jgi:hypothetical protein
MYVEVDMVIGRHPQRIRGKRPGQRRHHRCFGHQGADYVKTSAPDQTTKFSERDWKLDRMIVIQAMHANAASREVLTEFEGAMKRTYLDHMAAADKLLRSEKERILRPPEPDRRCHLQYAQRNRQLDLLPSFNE